MAKTRLPTLDITPELPQVVSQDLNWFYKPEAEPVSDTYGDLAKTLDNFAKGALTKMAVADEIELQQEGEAKAKADTAKIEYDEGFEDAEGKKVLAYKRDVARAKNMLKKLKEEKNSETSAPEPMEEPESDDQEQEPDKTGLMARM